MAAERKERTVEELYNVMEMVLEPKITPVLRGSYRMQGPVDETDNDIQKNMVSPRSGKRFGNCSKGQKVHMRGESGTCNVCSAPCSSCMHLKRAFMGSKSDDFSDETCRGNAASQSSANEADALSAVKNRARDSLQHTVSEASNPVSVNSSHDSFSENADSKASLRLSAISDASKDVKMVQKLTGGGTIAVDHSSPMSVEQACSHKNETFKVLEWHDDSISCVSGLGEADIAAVHKRNVGRTNISYTSAPMSSLAPEQSSLYTSETLTAKGVDAGSCSPKRHSLFSHSENGKSISISANVLDLEKDPKSEEPPDETMKCSGQDEQDKKDNKVQLADVQEPLVQDVLGDGSDESDIVEQDVKVCDICGDAGREDMLAICCRCSDGAEHIYCMRIRLPKVPEGDWLCEECKFAEESENQKQDMEGIRTSKESSTTQVPDAVEKRTNKDSSSIQVSGKRHAENVDVASAAKRQALEASAGLPQTYGTGRTIGLSWDSSFKSLDRGTFGNRSSNDTSENARSPTNLFPRLQSAKGTLSKSNSFNTINSKPKVRLVDEFVPQKQKGSREHASVDIKEGPARILGKSMSFKTPNSGRSSSFESKVKRLLTNPRQDLKGIKQVKGQTIFERKNITKSDHLRVSPGTSNSAASATEVDKKFTARSDTKSLSSVKNNRDPKVLQSDGISNTLPKPRRHIIRTSADIPVSSVGALAANGSCSSSAIEKKLNLGNITNQDEKSGEKCASQARTAVTTGSKSAPCHKCKETGHTAEFCSSGSVCTGKDASSAQSPREELPKGSKLKAAIHATMVRRPEIYRKQEVSDQPDGISLSSTDLNSEKACEGRFSVSNEANNLISAEGTDAAPAIISSSSTDSHKNMHMGANNGKQLSVPMSDTPFPAKLGESVSMGTAEKFAMRDLHSHDSKEMSHFLKMSVIPEHEYIWQGTFEVHRGGKHPDFCEGIQAHLSSCAVPKVLGAANKFPHNVSLYEVPRLSTWPVQFHDYGAKEDNIALYFFAQNIESYEKSYKILLDKMIKNDLALKGNLDDGIELLIFPSNQLPDKSQRWNMLFFLWGVFRGRRVDNSDSSKKLNIPNLNVVGLNKDIPAPVMTLFDKLCFPNQMDGESVVFNGSSDQNSNTISSNCHNKESSLHWTGVGSVANSGWKDHRFESKPSSMIAKDSAQFCQEMANTSPRKDPNNLEFVLKFKSSFHVTGQNGEANKGERHLHLDSCRAENASSWIKNDNEVGMECSIDKIVDRMVTVKDSDRQRVKLEMDLNGCIHRETSLKSNPSPEGVNFLESNNRKLPLLDLSEAAPSTSVTEVNSMLHRDGISKKQRTGFGEMYVSTGRSMGGNCQHDAYAAPRNEEKRDDEACDEKVIREDLQTSERYFFPLDSRKVEDFELGANFMPWKPLAVKDEDQSHDLIPNLDLALGAETKPPNKGMLPLFVGLRDNKYKQNEPRHQEKAAEVDEKALSLSLSFPF